MRVPPPAVLDAFGASAPPNRLPGGQGTTYRSGNVVLKPAFSLEEAHWVAYVYSTVNQQGFTVPRPVATRAGDWVFGGWTAWRFLEGDIIEKGCYGERLKASRAFHRALKAYRRPGFLDHRNDSWSQADRVVWEGQAWNPRPKVAEVYARLQRLAKPLSLKEQLVHGDISGNMLFSPGKPLAVIDFSPYWRPAAFAEAVFVVDAVLWEGASWNVATLAGSGETFFQLLVRAAMRRLAEVDLHYTLRDLSESYLEQVGRYAKVALELEKMSAA